MSEIMLADLQAAERLLTEARDELRAYTSDPDRWTGCFERLDKHGYKHLQLSSAHFAETDALQMKVERAARHLQMVKRQYFGGAVDR